MNMAMSDLFFKIPLNTVARLAGSGATNVFIKAMRIIPIDRLKFLILIHILADGLDGFLGELSDGTNHIGIHPRGNQIAGDTRDSLSTSFVTSGVQHVILNHYRVHVRVVRTALLGRHLQVPQFLLDFLESRSTGVLLHNASLQIRHPFVERRLGNLVVLF